LYSEQLSKFKATAIDFYDTYKLLLFWGTFSVITISGGILGYQIAEFLKATNFLGNFNKLPEWVQEVLSLDGKWVEAFCNLLVPFFIVFSIKFYALDIKQSRKKWFFKALPFLPYLNFLSRTPVMFIQGTASIMFGAFVYLSVKFESFYALLFIFPLIITGLSIGLRSMALDDLSKVSTFTKKHKNKFGHVCIVLAVTCWFYANVITLVTELILIFKNLS